MNTLIVTGGSIDYKFACEYLKKYTWDYVVCADAGMKFCHTAGIQPDLILGDFDSVDDASYTYFKKTCPERMEQFPTHKDETDTEIVDAHNRIRMVDGQIMLQKSDQFGKFVSLIPFTPEVTGITLKGFAYEVENFTLVSGIARGVSNELEAETASITCQNGILLVIESRD